MPTLEKYVKKILEIQQLEYNKAFSQEELKELAEQLGLTDREWAEIQETFEAHVIRGRGFLKYSNWEDAIEEFEQALILHPNHLDVMFGLAESHHGRWQNNQDDADRNKALDYAERCLEVDPGHDPSLHLISSLKKRLPGTKKTIPPTLVLALGSVIVVLLVALGLVVYWPEKQKAPVIDKPAVTSTAVLPAELESVLFTEGLDIPVRYMTDHHSSGLDLSIQRSLFKQYKDAWSYRMAADVLPRGIEVEELKFKLEFLDPSDRVFLVDYKNAQESYQPTVRSGDVLPLDYLEYEKNGKIPDLKEVRISVHSVVKHAAPDKYESSPAIEFQWDNKPANMDLEIRERFRSSSQGFILDKSKLRHELVLEIRNTGNRPIRKLEMEIVYLGPGRQVVKTQRVIVNIDSYPRIMVGQTRVKSSLVGLENMTVDDFQGYRVKVTQIQ